MSLTHTFRTVVASGANSIDKTVSQTVDGEDRLSLTLTTSASYVNVLAAFALAALKSFCLASDQNITLKTNASDGGADQTISIVAGNPLAWNALSGLANPFTVAVTTFWILNNSGQTATVEILIGRDATP